MPPELEDLLDRIGARAAPESIDAQRQHLAVRARLLDQTVPQTHIDRYVVRSRLGSGGMGVVYAAYDEELDRELAIKLVRDAQDNPAAQERLLREARALARVSHPHVVEIYDVGLHRDRVFVAMALLPGPTLREHLVAGQSPWRDIVGTYVQAGEGLAAAHAVGLVHRDFKPDNAMLGHDGHVRVVDFGLALSRDTAPSFGPDAPPTTIDDASITASGRVVGTPAYMAPEQFAGLDADARTDQFSYCVALWEALFGERPFGARTTGALGLAVTSGEIDPPKHPEYAPPWLHKVLRRGLAADPEARWSSMAALLDQLQHTQTRRRARRTLGGVLAVGGGLCITSVLAWKIDAGVGAVSACTAGAARASSAWSEPRREQVRGAFRSASAAFADGVLPRVESQVSLYVQEWGETRDAACTAVDRDLTEGRTRLDAQLSCLDVRAAELSALIGVWAEANATAVDGALRAVEELKPPRACTDPNAPEPPPPTIAPLVAEVNEGLAQCKAMRAAGRYAEALAQAQVLLPRAVATGHAPTAIEARRLLALLQHELGAFADAEANAKQTYDEARAARMDHVAFGAALELVTILGDRRSQPVEALRWARHAEALLDAGAGDDADRGRLLAQVGLVRHLSGDLEQGLADQRQGLALLERAGAESRILVAAHGNLGLLLRDYLKPEEALEHYGRAIEIMDATMPPNSLYLGHILDGIAGIHVDQQRYDLAEAEYRRSLQIRERILGPQHSSVAGSLTGLGTVLVALDRLDEAQRIHTRAVAIVEAGMGKESRLAPVMLANLAHVHLMREEYTTARELLVRALETAGASLGPTHPTTINTLSNLAYVEDQLGNHERVLELLTRVFEAKRALLGDEHPEVVAAREELAGVREVVANESHAAAPPG